MEKVLFSEEQKFDQWWFRMIILCSAIPLVVIFGIALYRQIILGKPWGDHPAPDAILISITAFLFVVMTGLTRLAFRLRLITDITEDGLRYRFPPFIRRFRTISKYDIGEFRTREYNAIREYGGWGIRQGGSKQGIAYNVKGNKGLQLRLKNGRQILFGTQRPDAIRAAMDRLMKPTDL